MSTAILARARAAYERADLDSCLEELASVIGNGDMPMDIRAMSAADAARLLKWSGRENDHASMVSEGDVLFAKIPEPDPGVFTAHALLIAPLEPERAREILERGLKQYPDDPDIGLELLRLRIPGEDEQRARRRDDKLARELERILMDAPSSPGRDFRLGRLYFYIGDAKRARARIQAALEADDNREFASPARRILIHLCWAAGDYPAAELLAEAELEALTHDPEARRLLARTYLLAYNLDMAAAEYEKLAVQEPENAETWTGLGLVQLILGRDGLDTYSRAVQLFTRALECTPGESRGAPLRAGLLRARAHALAKLHQRDPRSGYDNLKKARDDLEESLKLAGDSLDARDALVILKARMGLMRGLENLKLWGPAAASLLSLLVFALAQGWLFLDMAAKSLSVPAYIVLTLGSLSAGLAGLFLMGRNREAPANLPLRPPSPEDFPVASLPGQGTEPRFSDS